MSIATAANIMIEVMESYNDPKRGYHDWGHVQDCLARLKKYEHMIRCKDELEIAIIFHDCVYAFGKVPSGHNEYESAIEAMAYLDAIGATASQGQMVYEFIMDTTHLAPARTGAGQLMQDIDLLGFADSRACAEAAVGIRHEFKSVPDEVYYPERIKVLQWFLDKPSIFHTPRIKEEFEQLARTNIANEIKQIQESYIK